MRILIGIALLVVGSVLGLIVSVSFPDALIDTISTAKSKGAAYAIGYLTGTIIINGFLGFCAYWCFRKGLSAIKDDDPPPPPPGLFG